MGWVMIVLMKWWLCKFLIVVWIILCGEINGVWFVFMGRGVWLSKICVNGIFNCLNVVGFVLMFIGWVVVLLFLFKRGIW